MAVVVGSLSAQVLRDAERAVLVVTPAADDDVIPFLIGTGSLARRTGHRPDRPNTRNRQHALEKQSREEEDAHRRNVSVKCGQVVTRQGAI